MVVPGFQLEKELALRRPTRRSVVVVGEDAAERDRDGIGGQRLVAKIDTKAHPKSHSDFDSIFYRF